MAESPRQPGAESPRRPGVDPVDNEHGGTESSGRQGVDPVGHEHSRAESPRQPGADLVVREHGDQVHAVFLVRPVAVAVESPRRPEAERSRRSGAGLGDHGRVCEPEAAGGERS